MQSTVPVLEVLAAAIRAAGLYLLVPILGFRLLRNPPVWMKGLFVKQAKILGAEVQFERLTTPEHSADPSVTASLDSAAAPLEPGNGEGSLVTEAPQVKDAEPNAMELLRQGQYDEGMEILYRQARGKSDEEGINLVAFGHFIAFEDAKIALALADLRRLAQKHPGNFDVHLWMALALDTHGDTHGAVREIETAYRAARNDDDRITAVIIHARILGERRDWESAQRLLVGSLTEMAESGHRWQIYRALARLFEQRGDDLIFDAMLMYELAARSAPVVESVHFDLAYKYAQLGADHMALFHYRSIIEREARNGLALNNAGISAQNIALPIAGAKYLHAAADVGSSLALSNIANSYLRAGFVDQARSAISKAREASEPDRRVEIIAGEIATTEQREEGSLKASMEYVAKLRTWRLRHGEAILKANLNAADWAGEYFGSPGKLTISVIEDGAIRGEFARPNGGTPGEFVARAAGNAIYFSWSTRNTPGTTLLTDWLRKSGNGLLILEGASLTGYFVEEQIGLDAKPSALIGEFSLTRVPPHPSLALPPGKQ